MAVVAGLLWILGVVVNLLCLIAYTLVTSLQSKEFVWTGGQTFWAVSIVVCVILAVGIMAAKANRFKNDFFECF